MKNAQNKNYYLSLDIGTDSVGYAATDENYNLLKFHGEPVWGATVFDAASLNTDRRAFRTARRRLDRRQQRIDLLQELFAKEIGKIDPRFFIRMEESTLYPEDKTDKYTLFNDKNFTDKKYHELYPTIHHLIDDLMKSSEPHDVRLVYLACAWLVAHRGHFLQNISVEKLSDIKDFNKIYDDFFEYFEFRGFIDQPWNKASIDTTKLAEILKRDRGVTQKYKELCELIYNGKAPKKDISDEFPFSKEGILKLLAGGTYDLAKLFDNEDYAELTNKSVSLSMDDDKLAEISAEIGDDYDLIENLRSIYDWSILVNILAAKNTISEAKIKVYEQHQRDLAFLKHLVKTYIPEKYDEVFRKTDCANYAAYSRHTDEPHGAKWGKNKVEFSDFLKKIVDKITPSEADKAQFEDMKERLQFQKFLPKQKDGDNRVIPNQLYLFELKEILKNASEYLPFLNETDEDGISTKSKIESIFSFRIPYFVGPLNKKSDKAWLVRKAAGKILPWNFEKIVDIEATEEAFINELTNKCSYIPGEDVLPKDSLFYHKFEVLNEINNLKIDGEKISVELKKKIFNEIFMINKKVTRKRIEQFLIKEGFIEKGREAALTGIDITIKSDLMPQHAFKRLLDSNTLTENEVEEIIKRSTYAEDKSRLSKWLEREFSKINSEDRKYICNIKIKDFGRLSRKFLCELQGINKETGEPCTILGTLWNTNCNLMEILANDRFTFTEEIEKLRKAYYSEHGDLKLEDRLDEMYISNAVKRPIYRALNIVGDVTKAFGKPAKIFIEMTRGVKKSKKERTKSRKDQILELYDKFKNEDVLYLRKQLEDMGVSADNKLQGDKLFLYFMQMGKCMYTGKPIDLSNLGSKLYDIDHIYPQSYIKDDSIINNKVLVLSEANGLKGDKYPIEESVRNQMRKFWEILKEKEFISEEKFKRLTRATPFTEDEKLGFIKRQLTETSQSTKAVATLLKEHLKNTEIVYCKAGLTSEFRQEFDLFKSRLFNDLHHAVDAYLNIVTGNVYNMKFTKNFNINTQYTVKTKALFTHPVICNGKIVWDGDKMLAKVKETAVKNNAHFTKFAFFKKGGLFDQMPVPAASGLVPRKKDLPTEKYGGYNKAGSMFFIPVRYKIGKKQDIMIMSVELLHGKHFLEDKDFAQKYSFSRLEQILGKKVDEVSFPLGMRAWKVNTVLSLDGFRICIAGSASGSRCIIAQPIMQFSADKSWQFYLKKLEMFDEKCSKNKNYIYSEEYDKISVEKNIELYDLYIKKLKSSIYSKRVNAPTETLEKGIEKFILLDIKEQAKTLLNIHQVFGRMTGGCDLTAIGGVGKAAATLSFSSIVSNWKKNYSDVRIIDSSASGLWKKESENLLELLKV